ncbi:hypothetical protein [Hanstruepera ponticola]|uniref:hypothetical protein n=1 Tax=Hanstruepera ponticola TaxID=2042995 RepID=UPI000CF035C7|nr:hypothetical protein [Hanstruepera ponticola]
MSKNSNSYNETKTNAFEYRTMQRVRIDFESPNGYVRPLLLGFTTDNAATDGVDYGYDGANFDQFPDDLFWLIENDSYVIQGVGEFDQTKQYPLALFLENSGNIAISLNSLENFDTTINVFVYDSHLDTYTAINDTDFSMDISSGEYLNRFFIAFQNNNTSDENNSILNTEEFNKNETSISYVSSNQELIIKSSQNISKVEVYAMTGQKLLSIDNVNSKETKIPLNNTFKSYGIVKAYSSTNLKSKIIMIN